MSAPVSNKTILTQFVKERLAKLDQQEKDAKPGEKSEVVNDNLLFLRGAQEALTRIGVSAEDAAPVTKAVTLLDARLDLEDVLQD